MKCSADWLCVDSENQAKFMQDRITQVEKNFGDLCDGFAKYARGIAKLRDRGE
jgi:protein FAM92